MDITDPNTIDAIDNFAAIGAVIAGAIDPSLQQGLSPLTGGTVGTQQALPSSAANNQTLIIVVLIVAAVILLTGHA